jgi:hypothetical protein
MQNEAFLAVRGHFFQPWVGGKAAGQPESGAREAVAALLASRRVRGYTLRPQSTELASMSERA